MSNLYAVVLCVAVCLACDLDLHYRVNNGDYLIVNPDSDTYNGIQAFDASGDECTTEVIEIYGFTVTGCGLVSVNKRFSFFNLFMTNGTSLPYKFR